jgi:hypothetical protein
MKNILSIISLLLSITAFSQSVQIPASTIMEARMGEATVLKDNNAGGVFAEVADSLGIVRFTYQYKSSENERIADDELTEIITFNIKSDKTGKFLLTGNALTKAQGSFYRGCFCRDRGTFPIVSGTIRGAKLTKTTWYVNLNVNISVKVGNSEQIVSRKVKGIFNIIPQQ